MKRLLVVTTAFLTIAVSGGANFDIEAKVWELVKIVYPKDEIIKNCRADIQINFKYERLIIKNNVMLCGEFPVSQYKRILREGLELALSICYEINFKNRFTEHIGTRYSKVWCVWPKEFFEMNYCIAGIMPNSTSGRLEDLDENCTESKILEKFRTRAEWKTKDGVEELEKVPRDAERPSLLEQLAEFDREELRLKLGNEEKRAKSPPKKKRQISWKLVITMTVLITILSVYSTVVCLCTPRKNKTPC